jgi:hypothetical protein
LGRMVLVVLLALGFAYRGQLEYWILVVPTTDRLPAASTVDQEGELAMSVDAETFVSL